MRINFGAEEPEEDESQSLPLTYTRSPTQKEEIEWVPLHNHPIFALSGGAGALSSASRTNLIAWDGASRLYFWDPHKQCLHRLSLRLGEPEPTSVLAASSSKVLQSDIQIKFVVSRISINRNGSAMILFGSEGACIMHLYGETLTTDNTIICRTRLVNSQIYFDKNNPIRTLQISWHPYGDTHLGILSSDSVFRIYDFSSDVEKPEQEYFLQPVEPGRSCNAAAICPTDFSFGREHLWDRFSVFVSFSDGSIYTLCPVVPFGSVYGWESIWEIYSDAHMFGLKSSNSTAVSNCSLAIAWLEATFPELTHQTEGSLLLRAQPYVPFDASVCLQGPLRKVCSEDEDSEVLDTKFEGCAVGFLYSSINKDSILVTAWSNGQLQIDALADEIQPVWNVGSQPRLSFNSHDQINGLAMICESRPDKLPLMKFNQPLDDTVWLGSPPPLLRLAIVDLALPKNMDHGPLLSLFSDPLVPERIYCLHGDGIDSIVLRYLPFTSQTSGKDETMRAPLVDPVLSTCNGKTCSPAPLCGFVALADSFGYSWIVGVISSGECVVLEMKGWNALMPHHFDGAKKLIASEELSEMDAPDIISKELLNGPKVVLAPQAPPNTRSVAADTHQGRTTLLHYFKLFHENYVEYAHKVWFELKHHETHVKKIIDDQHARLREAHQKLSSVEENQLKLNDRINGAAQKFGLLEDRLQNLRNLPAARKRPLSRAEHEFKSELDRFTGLELDALHSTIETLNARTRKYTQSPPRQVPGRRKNQIPDTQISNLRLAIEKLSLVNSENSKKVKLVECALRSKEKEELK